MLSSRALRRAGALASLGLLVVGCSKRTGGPSGRLGGGAAPRTVSPEGAARGTNALGAGNLAAASWQCGAFTCEAFADARTALTAILREHPVVIGVGEAHALAQAAEVPATAVRFRTELLPFLDPRPSHLFAELLAPPAGCEPRVVDARRSLEPVVAEHAPDSQQDYVDLGNAAKDLGIEPFVLTPTCDELAQVSAAGDDAPLRTMELIAALTARRIRGVLARRQGAAQDLDHPARPERPIVAYGGLLHNDRRPETGHELWSYAPELERASGGAYLELDLIVREYVKDTPNWQNLPWYTAIDTSARASEYVVLHAGPHQEVLFFPLAELRTPPEVRQLPD